MRLLIIILSLLITTSSYAAPKDIRISDADGDVLDINTNGTLPTSSTIDATGTLKPGAKDIRICDSDGDCLDINPDGSVTTTNGLQ